MKLKLFNLILGAFVYCGGLAGLFVMYYTFIEKLIQLKLPLILGFLVSLIVFAGFLLLFTFGSIIVWERMFEGTKNE